MLILGKYRESIWKVPGHFGNVPEKLQKQLWESNGNEPGKKRESTGNVLRNYLE